MFSHKITLYSLLLFMNFNVLADINSVASAFKFVRHNVGIEIIKPDNWNFYNTKKLKQAADNDANSEQDLDGQGKQVGTVEHVVTLVYKKELYDYFTPSLAIAKVNEKFPSAAYYIYKRIDTDWSKERNFKINIKPMDTRVGGYEASYANTSFSAETGDGYIDFSLDYWVMKRDDHMLVFSYVSPVSRLGDSAYEELVAIRGEIINVLNGIHFKDPK